MLKILSELKSPFEVDQEALQLFLHLLATNSAMLVPPAPSNPEGGFDNEPLRGPREDGG